MDKAKILLFAVLLSASANASIMYTLTIDLSPLHAGSLLTSSVTVANAIPVGGSTSMSLSFSDPADYSPISLATTLSVGSGTFGDTVRFSPVSFVNLVNHATLNLAILAPAQCTVDVPCQASGRYQINNPALYTGNYSITAIVVPEPGYTLLLAGLGICLFLGRRGLRRQ